MLESQPGQPPADDDQDDPPAAPPADVSPPAEGSNSPSNSPNAPAAAADAGAPEPSAAGPVLAACIEDGGSCTVINISVADEAAERCIELSVDNCRTFDRAGIPVDTPVTWRLGSASTGSLEDECVPAEYDPDSTIVVDGSGTIGWNLTTRRPSDLVLDLSLEPAGAAAPISIQGNVAGEVPDCD